jgi:hypothetical protein
MDGNADLALVRDVPRIAPGLPVILVTGFPSLETAIPSVHMSVSAYLKKPLDYVRVREHVLRATEQSRLYRSLTDIHHRLAIASEEFATIPGRLNHSCSPEDIVPLSLVRDLASVLSQVLALRAEVGCDDRDQSLCKLLDCRLHPNFQDAIHETIEVLKRTKTSFKSKELGVLRLRLESILEKTHELPAPYILRATLSRQSS